MKVFSNCKIVLDFDNHMSFKDKTKWRKKVTENGGVISFVLTKQASFYIVFNKKNPKCEYKIRKSIKYNIPVLHPEYIDLCIAKNRLQDAKAFQLKGVWDSSKFKKGKVQSNVTGSEVRRKVSKKFFVNLTSHPSWRIGAVDAPKFEEDSYELAKWAVLTNKDETRLEVLEVHVRTRNTGGTQDKYRLYAQTATVHKKVVEEVEEAIVWYFNTPDEVISGYEQLHRQYRGAPMNMHECRPGEIDIIKVGSKALRLVISRLHLWTETISPKVATLTNHLWNEALVEVDTLLEIQMKHIKEKQIEEAKVILEQLADKLVSGAMGSEVQSLHEQFYETLPHRQKVKEDSWTLNEVSRKKNLCQLLSDILAVSEATDWSPDTTLLAKYRALGCHIEHVDQSNHDDAKIQEVLSLATAPGLTVHNLYRVRRTIEETSFKEEVGNVRLLTHASPVCNYLGILSRGLLLPSVVKDKLGVSRTDAGLLGAGIYFSDDASKSAQYSTRSTKTGTRLMVVCDVAVGNQYTVTKPDPSLTSPPDGYDSVQGVKSTDEQTSSFMHNEFVIYNPCHQCVRYLVEFSRSEDVVVLPPTGPSVEVTQADGGQTPQVKPQAVDLQDVIGVEDPLGKVKAGLQASGEGPVPLKSVHVRARMLDMVAKVVVLQEYRNDNKKMIEAKYVFPLDDTAAVCGFEAFINGKHIIGKVKEKGQARRDYKEAVSKGHGAYLMEEETPDVFSVSVGNLPPHCDVLIKITYVAEIQTEGEALCYWIPAAVAPWVQDAALAQNTQSNTTTVKVKNSHRCNVTLQVAMEMPFDIRRIHSPTHSIKYKKTATKAIVSLPSNSNLDNGFQLLVNLAEVHVPRMWVEKHPEDGSEACMLTFYPEFEAQEDPSPHVLILLDMSNSMKGTAESDAKKVALLALDHLSPTCQFNIIKFGSSHNGLFPCAQKVSKFSLDMARKFVQESQALLGSTDIWQPLHISSLLAPRGRHTQNIFLISDGHVTQETHVVAATRDAAQQIRVFTLGVSSSANHHLLRSLASVGGGCYEHYSRETKSQWQRKVVGQVEKACQPGLSNVHVDWLQTDDTAPHPVQAPNQIPCLFSGSRQVVYGFVDNCKQATLKAMVDGREVSTMVSTVDLNITTGTMLHQLTARAIINDYETGLLDSDHIKHKVKKVEKKQYVIELSKKYSIVTPYTSFVAVEERNQDDFMSAKPVMSDLVAEETVDILPYMDWQCGTVTQEEDPCQVIEGLLKMGTVQETFSLRQAEETYSDLVEHIPFIRQNKVLTEKVYDTLGRFYDQTQAAVVGDILSQIETMLQETAEQIPDHGSQMKRKRRSELSLASSKELDIINGSASVALQPPEINLSPEMLDDLLLDMDKCIDIELPTEDSDLETTSPFNLNTIRNEKVTVYNKLPEPLQRFQNALGGLQFQSIMTSEATRKRKTFIKEQHSEEQSLSGKSGGNQRKNLATESDRSKQFPESGSVCSADLKEAVRPKPFTPVSSGKTLAAKGARKVAYSGVSSDSESSCSSSEDDEADIAETPVPSFGSEPVHSEMRWGGVLSENADGLVENVLEESAVNSNKFMAGLYDSHEPQKQSVDSNQGFSQSSMLLNASENSYTAVPFSGYIPNLAYISKPSNQTFSSYNNSFQANATSNQTYLPTVPDYSHASQAYNPTSLVYNSTSQAYSPTSPAYSPTSPSYSPTSQAFQSTFSAVYTDKSKPKSELNNPIQLRNHSSSYPSYIPSSQALAHPSTSSVNLVPDSYIDLTLSPSPSPMKCSSAYQQKLKIAHRSDDREIILNTLADKSEDDGTSSEISYFTNLRTGRRSRSRSDERSRGKKSRERSRKDKKSRSQSREISRESRSRSRSRKGKRSRSRSRKDKRSRSRSRNVSRESRHRKSKKSMDSLRKSRSRSRSRKGKRSRSRSRKDKRSRSRSRNMSRESRHRKSKRSMDSFRKSRSRSRSRKGKRSRSRSRDKSLTTNSIRPHVGDLLVCDRATNRSSTPVNRFLAAGVKVDHELAQGKVGGKILGPENKGKKLEAAEKTGTKSKLVRNPVTGRWERVEAGLTEDTKGLEPKSDPVPGPIYSPRVPETGCIWAGIRHGQVPLQLHQLDRLTHLMQETDVQGKQLKFFPLTDQLCNLIGVSKTKLTNILIHQGVKSLGVRIMKLVESIVASLMALVLVTRLQYTLLHGELPTVTMDTKIAIATEGDRWVVKMNNHGVLLPAVVSPVVEWLQYQETQLPPLYRTLELGTDKASFVKELAKVFNDGH